MYDLYPFLVLAVAIIALIFAIVKFYSVKKLPEGTEQMMHISQKIRKGAMTYLKRQYKTVGIFFVVMLVGLSSTPRVALSRTT